MSIASHFHVPQIRPVLRIEQCLSLFHHGASEATSIS